MRSPSAPGRRLITFVGLGFFGLEFLVVGFGERCTFSRFETLTLPPVSRQSVDLGMFMFLFVD